MRDNFNSTLLGNRIMQRRKFLKITQSELASAVGISCNQISNIENGRSLPKINTFVLICNELKCNADYLLSGVLKASVKDNLFDMIALLSPAEQQTLLQLLECYIHKNDSV